MADLLQEILEISERAIDKNLDSERVRIRELVEQSQTELATVKAGIKKLETPNCGLSCGKRGCTLDCPHHKP